MSQRCVDSPISNIFYQPMLQITVNGERHVLEMRDVREAFDVRLFLRTSYATAKQRREARKGYVTLEGFWEDPPGYVDQIVWPNYVQDHKFLFERGDVEADLDAGVCEELGIEGMPREAEGNLSVGLEWAVRVLEKRIQ